MEENKKRKIDPFDTLTAYFLKQLVQDREFCKKFQKLTTK